MKTIARGPAFSADPRDVLSVPDDFGRALVTAGAADQLPDEDAPPAPPIETAVVQAETETATAPTAHPAKKGRR